MDDISKSREQLLVELEELHLAYKFLKSKYDKEFSMRMNSQNGPVESGALFQAIHEMSPIAIEYYDAGGSLLEVNPSCLKLFGVKEIGDVQGFSLFSDPNLNDEQKERLNKGEPVRYEGPFDFEKVKSLNLYKTCHNGIIWLDVLITPIKDDNNNIDGYLVHIQDITEQKEAKVALTVSEEKYRNLYNYAPVGLYRTTPEGKIVMVNEAIRQMLEYPDTWDPGSVNLSREHFGPAFQRLQFTEEIERLGEVKNMEAQWVTGKGRVITVRESARAIRDSNGAILFYDGSAVDITRSKKMEHDLNEALVRAESSDRLKTAFMNNISHEVRTPLNGILGFAEMIDDPDITPEDRILYKDILRTSSDRLLNTISSYMDISLLVSGGMQIHKDCFNLMDLLKEGHDSYFEQAKAKGVTLVIDSMISRGELLINSDKELIRKVFFHLLANSIKFTDFGIVTIGCRILGSEIEITVKDPGIGISEELCEKIFDSFLQVDHSNTRRHEGSGLGLAIAKGLVELLGGRIWVQSEVGSGSTFGFSIPGIISVNSDNEMPETEKPLNFPNGPVILIVEDDPINIYLLETMLGKTNANVWHVENGVLAVDSCRNHPEISIVLMDLKMPVMDGFVATSKIREFRSDLPVIAVTAFAMPGDKERAMDCGCNDYLSKPFNSAQLLEKLRGYINL